MNFIQKLVQQIEYGDYVPVAKYGEIYSEKVGRERFTLSPQLLMGKSDRVLRLDINCRWGGSGKRNIIDLHFPTLDEIRTPFEELLRDVDSHVTEPNVKLQWGAFEKVMLNVVTGKIVRSYGQIDRHPKNAGRFRVEMFLSWDERQYWILLCEGQVSVEWSKLPVGAVDALNRLFPRIEEALRKASRGTQIV